MGQILSRLTFLVGLALFAGVLAKPQETSPQEQARQLLQEASLLVKDIPEGQQSSAVANIAGQLARAGDLPDALAAIHSLKNSGDWALSLGIVAWAMDHSGNSMGSLDLLESSDLGQNKAQAYQQLALSHLDRGDFKGAARVMDLAQPNPYLRVDLFVRIAQQTGKSGDLAAARDAIRKALAIVEEKREEEPNCAGTLVGIAEAQAKIGDQAGALETLNHFSEIIHQLRPSYGGVSKDSLLQQLAAGQAETGDLFGATQTINELTEGSSRDFPLMSIARQQAKKGDSQEAQLTVSLMSESELKAIATREICILEAMSGKQVEALEAIKSVPNLGDRAYALASLALELAEKEDPAASGTLQLAIEAVSEPQAKIAGHVFEFIAVTQALLKDFAAAQQSIANMSDPESRVWPLWNITDMMVQAGDVQGALALANNEQAAHPKAYALLGTAQGILRRAEAEAKSKAKGGRSGASGAL